MWLLPILALLLAATVCSADLLEDTVVAAIKTARTNLAERESGIATVANGGVSDTQKANANSEFEQLKGDLLSEVTSIVVGKLGVGILDQLAALDVDALIEKAGAARKKRQATGCPGIADCSKPDSRVQLVSGMRRRGLFVQDGAIQQHVPLGDWKMQQRAKSDARSRCDSSATTARKFQLRGWLQRYSNNGRKRDRITVI